jgi:uncharacterized Fe-S radical SAM superfamily protein PflX
MYKACEHEELSRGITLREYQEALRSARKWGLHRGFED